MPVIPRFYFEDIRGLIDAIAQGVIRDVVQLRLIVWGAQVRQVQTN